MTCLNGLRVEGYTPPREIISDIERIARHVGLDVGGIEYLVDDRDGRRYVYDINALSNFVADAPNVIGFYPFERLTDYLVARLEGRSEDPAHADMDTGCPSSEVGCAMSR